MAPNHDLAWDCGTGNGQVAVLLSRLFRQVVATDISERQLNNATQASNITYRLEAAERSSLPDGQASLAVVAQAVHWFRFDDFYQEVRRVLKPKGILAVLGYGPFRTDTALDDIIGHFYNQVVGPYWDPERRYVDEGYRTIPFPFTEIPIADYEMAYEWPLEVMAGYLGTWSAVQHYRKDKGVDPIPDVTRQLAAAWGSEATVKVRFPVLLRVGRLKGKG
ncbi:MAG: class I SAM-dependent methyltransferase [Phaeodactylibacter sp.]|nr:class I SAM-dependent methyltransferase [Phaeodactylibacter sp.]